MDKTERFLKLSDVQEMFGVSRSTVWRWQAERGLKVFRVGEVVRIRESELQAFLKRHETGMADGAVQEIEEKVLTSQAACGTNETR